MYPLFNAALSGCGDIAETIESWFTGIYGLIARIDYAEKRDEIYGLHKDEIDQYQSLGETRW